jgi:hypothetical protein
LNIRGIVGEELAVILEPQPIRQDVEPGASLREIAAKLEQFLRAHRVETDLVEETQKPRVTGLEFPRDLESVPHLAGAPDELVPTGTLHAVHA